MKEAAHFEFEVQKGQRFEFGRNWNSFIKLYSEERLEIAIQSLQEMLELDNLKEKTFLDIGCGSGLFSLAAHKLGAIVFSFDYDPKSIECTKRLRDLYSVTSNWVIESGSALDSDYLSSIGKFNIVYSYGVLHHTGNMAKALANACIPLEKGGKLFIGIYNDQGRKSRVWRKVKILYNKNKILKLLITISFVVFYTLRSVAVDLIRFKNPINKFRNYKKKRGMSMYHDWIDWIGGLPFEVASPEYIVDFFRKRKLQLLKLRTTNTLGVNQYIFIKVE